MNKNILITGDSILGFSMKKTYEKPLLRKLGDLRGIALGPSAGGGESGNPTTFRGADDWSSSFEDDTVTKGINSSSDPYAPADPGQP